MKTLLFLGLLLAGCQSKREPNSTGQPSNVTINGKAYSDSVSVDSAGNQVRVKPGAGRAKVSGRGNSVEIK